MARGGLCLERIPYPLDVFRPVEQHGVKTAGRGPRQGSKVVLSSEDQAPLLVRIDAGTRAAEIVAAALANLGKNQGFSLAQDQVNLAELAAEIGLYQLQAVLLQILRCS
jgi:hypothetical protein